MESTPRQKILFVITKSNFGGAQKYVFDMATSLARDTYDVAVVCGGSGPLVKNLEDAGIRVVSIKTLTRDINILGDFLSFFELIAIFRKEKPQVIHVNSSKAGALGALAGRIAKVPRIIFTCHGWAFNEERHPIILLIIKLLSWLTVIFSHTTITVSNRDLIDGEKLFGVRKKLVLVHNGIRQPVFKERNVAQAEIYNLARKSGVEIPKTSLLMGAIGELHKNKGYEYMLRAFALARKTRSSPYRLIIMGDGEEKDKLKKLIRELDLETDVALLGYVKDAPTYLTAFDAFALTSIKEGLPYVVIEAGFAGLPIVATNVGGVREIIEDMKTGILVQTRKPDDIAQGLAFLVNEKDRSKTFGSALKEKVIKDFSIEKMVEKTVVVYEGK